VRLHIAHLYLDLSRSMRNALARAVYKNKERSACFCNLTHPAQPLSRSAAFFQRTCALFCPCRLSPAARSQGDVPLIDRVVRYYSICWSDMARGYQPNESGNREVTGRKSDPRPLNKIARAPPLHGISARARERERGWAGGGTGEDPPCRLWTYANGPRA